MVTSISNPRFISNPLNCPVTRAMSIIGGKWKPIILNCIGDRTIRFGKLRQIIPAISNKVLANELKEMEEFGLIDGIVSEPVGGAHSNHQAMAEILKEHILRQIASLKVYPADALVNHRIEKYSKMGRYVEEVE